MNVLKMRPRGESMEAIEINQLLFNDRADWPEWLKNSWREDQPLEDGSLAPNTVVPDKMEPGSIRVASRSSVEIGRPGNWLVCTASGQLGVCTGGLLFERYEVTEGEIPVDKSILSPEEGGPAISAAAMAGGGPARG